MVDAGHDALSEWNPKEARGSYGTSIWKSIMKGKADFWKLFALSWAQGRTLGSGMMCVVGISC